MLISETKPGDWITYNNNKFVIICHRINYSTVININTGLTEFINKTAVVDFTSIFEHIQPFKVNTTFDEMTLGTWLFSIETASYGEITGVFIKSSATTAFCLESIDHQFDNFNLTVYNPSDTCTQFSTWTIEFPEYNFKG